MEINLISKRKTLANINELFNRKNDAIKFIDDYSSIILEAKIKVGEEKPKPEPTKAKTKHEKFPFELHEKFINEIKNDEKNINQETFKGYFFNHTLLFLAKELHNSNQNVNDEIVKDINDLLTGSEKDINTKKIPKNENPIVDIVEKILNFYKQQKVEGIPSNLACIARVAKVSDHSNLKILTPK